MTPERIIKLPASEGPQWIDLEAVEAVRIVDTDGEKRVHVHAKNHPQAYIYNKTWVDFFTQKMDAWMAYKNSQL